MVDGPTRRFHGDPFRPPTPGRCRLDQPSRTLSIAAVGCPFANSRLKRCLVPLGSCATKLVGRRLDWCWGRCRTSLGYGPLRPELPAAATVFGAEYVSAAPNPAGWILTEEVTSKKAELLSRL